MNTSTPDTLDRLLQSAGLRRDSQLAELLGVSPQAVSQARRKGRIPDGWVLKVASRFGLSTDWIFFGKEPDAASGSASHTDNEQRLARGLSFFGEVPAGRRNAIDLVMIPLVSARLAAGTGSLETSGDVLSYFSFRQDWLCRKGNPDKMVLMKVCGDSMEPDIRHGDMVLIDQSKNQIFGHAIYAMGINEEIYIKQVETFPGGQLVLRSRNPGYSPIHVDLHGDLAATVRVIGRVIWCCREI
ncbi:S24 family peptidase [uncultured Mailhella sp.]|uniref:LexA family transcriptional regulator n=1 Tax=uncultured Mailhella sp. TaxID=1981031 RepID=UPI0026238672|nr:S24 family peptidase [uncultured Mailhella sp.]